MFGYITVSSGNKKLSPLAIVSKNVNSLAQGEGGRAATFRINHCQVIGGCVEYGVGEDPWAVQS